MDTRNYQDLEAEYKDEAGVFAQRDKKAFISFQ